ncbi:MAG: PIN domain-containing protein [Candidatus Thiosymbion ectosymbiont of Robbea hypermnestra]|nr:PIN domain-containing protein [Candidatus Thiosymbion ectosymbiont of Robbea hypermnestra]
MKILFDTNIILDVMLDRKPFSDSAAKLVSKIEKQELKGFLGATTVTTIFYLAAKVAGRKKAKEEIGKLLSIFEIAPVNRTVLAEAVELQFDDYEDAVLHEAAKQAGLQGIVTRDTKDFQSSTLPVYSPEELKMFLSMIKRRELEGHES